MKRLCGRRFFLNRSIPIVLIVFLFFAVSFLSGCQKDVRETTGVLSVRFFDVGQADCAYVCFPDGQTLLIDTGGADTGRQVVSKLQDCGCESLDYLLLTHSHNDHVGGLSDILETFPIGAAYLPKENETEESKTAVSLLTSHEISFYEAHAGVDLPTGDVQTVILSPMTGEFDDGNETSAVLRIRYHDRSFLFCGDAGTNAEAAILKRGASVRADLVKVGHHGSDSASSAAFVTATGASYAVFSVGADNEYGHPSDTVLDRWEKEGAIPLRTDRMSDILLLTDGSAIAVGSYADRGYWKTVSFSDGILCSPETERETTGKQTIFWILDTGKHIAHQTDCPLCGKISEDKKAPSGARLDELEKEGYRRCPTCFPK